MTPFVSIIILTYNQERYIEQSILGVLNQRCDFPFEILIGEDCSTDNTLKICKEYEAKYPTIIKVIANEKNKGLKDNYFDVLLLSRGKYIADCAGDDYWIDPLKLQRQVDILEGCQNIVLTHTNYKCYFHEENRFQDNMQTYKDGTIASFFVNRYDLLNQTFNCFVFLCTACFRRDVFIKVYQEKTDFFRNRRYTCEDFQLLFMLLKEGDFYYEEKETVAYRILRGTISRADNIQEKFTYSYGIFLLRTTVIQQYSLDANRCRDFLDSRLRELLSLSILLGLKEETENLYLICEQLNFKPNKLNQFYRIVSSSSFLSFIFRKLKSLKK